jgi:uncharacterized membrane protein
MTNSRVLRLERGAMYYKRTKMQAAADAAALVGACGLLNGKDVALREAQRRSMSSGWSNEGGRRELR